MTEEQEKMQALKIILNFQNIHPSRQPEAVIDMAVEECVELSEVLIKLSKTLIKLNRIRRGKSYTPVTLEECKKHLVEEVGDVQIAIDELMRLDIINKDEVIDNMNYKYERWLNRINKEKMEEK